MLDERQALRTLPLNITMDRLLGGIELGQTLHRRQLTPAPGLLAEADGRILELGSAERAPAAVTGALAGVLDLGRVAVARTGISRTFTSKIAVLAWDESLEDEDGVTDTLRDRLAFWINLEDMIGDEAGDLTALDGWIDQARRSWRSVEVPDQFAEACVSLAAGLGIGSMRAPLLALRTAQILTALEGGRVIDETAVKLAGALVLAPRATRMPASSADDRAETEPPADAQPAGQPEPSDRDKIDDLAMHDRLIEAVRPALPADLLAGLAAGARARARGAEGSAGLWQKPARRGRPVGVRRGDPRRDPHLDLVATLTQAAPWQRLRRLSTGPAAQSATAAPSVDIRLEDLRFRLLKQRRGTLMIFAVDASGSAALHRLGEAKGAVELVLAQCYVRRDEAALIAFRGGDAQLLLPPTRSLARARKRLQSLPGGGATPLAAALGASHRLAIDARRRGQSAFVILLTDGRANIDLAGNADRNRAETDALACARLLARSTDGAILIDTAKRRRSFAPDLARAMLADYVPLPFADAVSLSRTIEGHVQGRRSA